MKEVELLGIEGCPTCKKISSLIDKVVLENSLDVHIEKVYNMNRIIKYEIAAMPGIVVDGFLRISGRIPAEEEIRALLS